MSSDLATLPGSPRGSAYLFAHFLRNLILVHRADLGDRMQHLPVELAGCLVPLASQARSTIEFVTALCERIGVQPVSRSGRPLVAALPQEIVDAYGFPRGQEQLEGQALGVGFFSVPWIDVVTAIVLGQLRPALQRSPHFFVAFALQFVDAEARRGFMRDFGVFDWIDTSAPRFPAADLSRAIAPRRWHVLITLLSPLAHGGDQSGSNVASIRREQRCDAFTGEAAEIPFVSGAAVRGLARDLMMVDWLARIGLTTRDIRPELAHALLAGGSIDAGAAMGVTNNRLRDAIREVSPAWDLFCGVIEGELMEGQLLVHDAVLVCRETAWMAAPALGWSIEEARERAPELPEAAAATVERLGTRHHHDDIPGKSTQMILHTQAIAAGHQLAWSVALRAGARATALQRSALAFMLGLLAEHGRLGAKAQTGFGQALFSEPTGAEDLVGPDLYLRHVAEHADRARAWLTGKAPLVEPAPAPVEGEAPNGKGKAKPGRKPAKGKDADGSAA
jgi:hypothetical protein